MRTLYLLRHAKSDWSDPLLDDHDRPLARRGRRARHLIAAHLAERPTGPPIGLVVSSTARRARETAEPLVRALGCELRLEPRLYPGTVDGMLEVVRSLPEAVAAAVLVGHNPAVEDLTEALTGGRTRYPTAALGTVELDVASWSEVVPGCGRLVGLVNARLLEPR